MKKWFISLSLIKKTVVISTAIVLFALLLTLPLFFNGLMEIPLGIILGGGSSVLSFALFIITDDMVDQKKSIRITIMLIIMMSLIHASALIISTVLYFALNVHLFNVFSTFISLFIGLLVHVGLSFIPEKKNG